MSVPSGKLNHIVNYLMKKDDDIIGQDPSGLAMDGGLFNDDDWPTNSDELLDNFFSMDGGLLDIPTNSMVDTMVDTMGSIPFGEQVSEPARSLAGSDSGLSMDHADLDLLDQQLSPLMMQPSDDDFLNKSFASSLQQINPSSCGDSHSPQSSSSPGQFSPSSSDVDDSPISWPAIEDKTEVSNCQNTLSIDLSQPVQTFQNITNLKRKSSSPPPSAIVLPKVQKNFIHKRDTIKNLNIMRSDKQRIILSNHQNNALLNHQSITVQSADVTSTQKKIIRVAPMTGNPRKILLPVTIKDMKDLRSIKIINAADLKNQTNIKLAAANFLQKSKQALENKKKSNLIYAALESEEHQYVMEDSTSDRGSCHSDDDDDDRMDDDTHVTRNENGQFPRLELTSEERRLLVKEGISLPSCYPLTRLEERELKRIRRKIRNKISAQDSRRRKKEYVDGLEDRVKQCTDENQSLMRKIKALQSQNQSLASQLKKLQNIVTKGSNYKSAQPATCLMVLLLSVALVMAPSLRAGNGPSQARSSHMSPGYAPHTALLNSIRRALLSAHTSLPSANNGVNTMEDSVEDVINVDDVSSGQPLNDHNYPLMERQVSNSGGRYTTCGYMDIPIDDETPPGKCFSPLKSLPVKLEKLEYDMEYDGNDLLLSHLEEVDGTDDSKDFKDESIKLYDMAMEKLEVVEGRVGFAHISGKLNEFLDYTPQAFKIDLNNFEMENKKKNITKIRTVMMANMELQ